VASVDTKQASRRRPRVHVGFELFSIDDLLDTRNGGQRGVVAQSATWKIVGTSRVLEARVASGREEQDFPAVNISSPGESRSLHVQRTNSERGHFYFNQTGHFYFNATLEYPCGLRAK